MGLHYIVREDGRHVWFAEIDAHLDSEDHLARLAGLAYQYKSANNVISVPDLFILIVNLDWGGHS